ncbi:MAG TPA: L-threonylcarbamoyladenylate synthase [Acidimicrobiales bacterium]|nr:L-threonylcarbamoyladenylate synthase [Acidimicrobiales bacterium]
MTSEIDAAAAALARGQVVGIPTDTVYGVAVDPGHPGATDRIFALKQRPTDTELPVLVLDADQAMSLCPADRLQPYVRPLMDTLWPGALTIVVPRRPGLEAALGGDGTTIGIRAPDNDVVRELCRRVGPLAVTSANLHGQPPLTTAAEVREAFTGDVAVVVDGGVCEGAPSTVVDCTGEQPVLIREGRIPWGEITALV